MMKISTIERLSSVGHYHVAAALFVTAVLLATDSSRAQVEPAPDASRLIGPIEILLTDAEPDWAQSLSEDFGDLREFYRARDFRSIWTGEGNAERLSALAFRTLATAEEEGLEPSDYHLAALTELAASSASDAPLRYELLMTDGVLRYARDVNLGRTALKEIDNDIQLPPRAFDTARALLDAVEEDRLEEFLTQLPPPHPEYARLREMLRDYRAIAAAGDWDAIPDGFDFEDASEAELSLLHRRLAAEEPTLAEAGQPDSREELLESLKSFQSQNGLAPDGIVGPLTLAMLNASPAEKVAQISANMERWRWLPREFEERYVMVNAADATLTAIRAGRVELRSRVIVGAVATRTPILRADAVSVTVNPPWNVPYSIAANEMLPRLRRDPTYLQNQNIVLVNGPADDPHGLNVDWNNVGRANFPYTLRQEPGPNAALGFLKLEMPSPYSVYLHDTPGRNLFARPVRTLSHGCIRVDQIRPLSSWVLSGDTAAAVEQLEADIAASETLNRPLSAPVPVYVVYWTVAENEDGTLGFRPDVYGRDQRLAAAM
jgi:murein L,D-transpeptidase YcbB/YkuD